MIDNLPLSESESARLYWELAQLGAFCTGKQEPWPYQNLGQEALMSLALAQTRYDPRLLEILVDFFRHGKLELNPIHFKQELKKLNALQIACAVGEFVLDSEAPEAQHDLFRFLMTGTRPMPTQLFYKNLYPIAGTQMESAITTPLWALKKWGFLASDPPLLKDHPWAKRVYLFDLASRLALLRSLAQRQKHFSLKDYLKTIRFSISRQQALKDLSCLRNLVKQRRTKGMVYSLGPENN